MPFSINEAVSGLVSTTIPRLNPGPHTITGKLTLPSRGTGSQTSTTVIVTVNQNGSPIYTGKPGADGFVAGFNAAANDVITVVTSSSNPIDQALNAVKMTLSIWEGGE